MRYSWLPVLTSPNDLAHSYALAIEVPGVSHGCSSGINK